MIIDKNKSKSFVSFKNLNLNLNDEGNNVKVSRMFLYIYQRMKRDKARVKIAKIKGEYFKRLDNADMSLFDDEFVNLYRNGVVEVKDTSMSYEMKLLYICTGVQNKENRIHLISFKDYGTDAITGNKIENFEKKDTFPFRQSTCFYEIYKVCRSHGLIEKNKLIITHDILKDVFAIFATFDGSKHNKVPELYYA